MAKEDAQSLGQQVAMLDLGAAEVRKCRGDNDELLVVVMRAGRLVERSKDSMLAVDLVMGELLVIAAGRGQKPC